MISLANTVSIVPLHIYVTGDTLAMRVSNTQASCPHPLASRSETIENEAVTVLGKLGGRVSLTACVHTSHVSVAIM